MSTCSTPTLHFGSASLLRCSSHRPRCVFMPKALQLKSLALPRQALSNQRSSAFSLPTDSQHYNTLSLRPTHSSANIHRNKYATIVHLTTRTTTTPPSFASRGPASQAGRGGPPGGGQDKLDSTLCREWIHTPPRAHHRIALPPSARNTHLWTGQRTTRKATRGATARVLRYR